MKWVSFGLAICMAAAAGAQEQAAFDLNDRGMEAMAKGDYDVAVHDFEQAIALWRSMGPQYVAHLATTQTNLGQTLSVEGKRREAARLFETALANFRRSLGPEHLRTLTTENLLGSTLLMLGDDAHAAELFDAAVPIERRLYPGDVQLARSLAGESLLFLRAEKAVQALPLAEEALTLAIKADGGVGLDTALAYSDVAEVHRVAGRPDRALPLYRKSRAIYERLLGPGHPRVASILSQEGLILMNQGKLSLAEKAMKQSLEILSKACSLCIFEQSVSETNLAMLRIRQAKLEEADRLLTHAIELREKYEPKPSVMMAATLQTLAQVREKERRHDDATRLQKRADTILSFR